MIRRKPNELHIYLSQEENSKLATSAQRCGLSKSEYVRRLIRGVVPRAAPSADYQQMTNELYRIANELGDISAVAKASGLLEADDITKLMQELYQNISAMEDEVHGEDPLKERTAVYGPD